MHNGNLFLKEIEEFIAEYGTKKIILYGAGKLGERIFHGLMQYKVEVAYFVDGNLDIIRGRKY